MASERWKPCGRWTGPDLVVTKGDLTKAQVDAIVSAAGSDLRYGSGVGAAITSKGGSAVKDDCKAWISQHRYLQTGQAVATRAGKLPCRYVIHTAGPSLRGSTSPQPTAHQAQRLRGAVRSALCEADRLKLASIAMPAISSGNNKYPKELATKEIVDECVRFACEKANSTTTLKTIVLMDIDAQTHERFVKALRAASEAKRGEGLFNSMTGWPFLRQFAQMMKWLFVKISLSPPTPIEFLSRTSADYKRILAELPEECASRVVSVRRVQIFDRHAQFETMKREIYKGGAQVTDLEPLYHGTPERWRASAIALNGFDFRHRSHGRSHGDAVYTSVNVGSALWYTKASGSLLRLRGLVVSNSTTPGGNTIVQGDMHVFPNPNALLSLTIIDFAPEDEKDRALVQRR